MYYVGDNIHISNIIHQNFKDTSSQCFFLYFISMIFKCLACYNQNSQIFVKSHELFIHSLFGTVLNLGPAWLADVCVAKT